jgi:large subunit ribosomal protein L18
MANKQASRLRRARRPRARFKTLNKHRLSVFRTPKHIYAQLFSPAGDKVLVSASTLEKSFKVDNTGNISAASEVGTLIAERIRTAGIDNIAFDRSGFKYHGRIKALADAAREAGLKI